MTPPLRLAPDVRVYVEPERVVILTEARRTTLTLPSDPDVPADAETMLLEPGAPVPSETPAALLRYFVRHSLAVLDGAPQPHGSVARQHGYLATRHAAPHVMQQRLWSSTVAVVGVGGVGSQALAHLVGAGIGHFVLVDRDDVELSNLNRQHTYSLADVGRAKARRAAAYVRSRARGTRVRTIQGDVADPAVVRRLISTCPDLAVLAVDQPVGIGPELGGSLWRAGVPHLLSHTGISVASCTSVLVPGTTCCPACMAAHLASRYEAETERAYSDDAAIEPWSFGPTNGIAAALVARAAVDFLGAGLVPAGPGQRRSTRVERASIERGRLETTVFAAEARDGCPCTT